MALRLKASASRHLSTQGKRLLSPLQLLRPADAEPSRDCQSRGGCRGQRSSAPSLARGTPPLIACAQSSQSPQTSRDFLPHVAGWWDRQSQEIYSRLLADMRERWRRFPSTSLPINLLRLLLAFSQSVASFARGSRPGWRGEEGEAGWEGRAPKGRGWFSRCCGWYFAVGEALSSPGSIFPKGYWEN